MVYPELMTIPFNTTKAEILTTIKGKELVQYRPPMKGNTGKHNQRSTIFFHKDRHDICHNPILGYSPKIHLFIYFKIKIKK
jgi:hypothetical protein